MNQIPNPTSEDLKSPLFLAIWDVIKTWDIKAPEYHDGYCGGNGSHVMLILNAVKEEIRESKIENILNENSNNTGSR
jgi:hypothetical protein